MTKSITSARAALLLGCGAVALVAAPAAAQQVFNTDVLVNGSLCVGLDCGTSQSFGSDTIRLRENNLRIHFDDTSNSSGFPSNDWRITANDSANGGLNYLSIDDATAGTSPFRVGTAPSNALVIEDTGDIGLNTQNPVLELHIVDGDSPSIRLEQDGSNGWTPHSWDMAGNETNFFIRDVNNSSHLPFRIKPGAGTNDALVIAGDGDVGMGTASPNANLEISSADSYVFMRMTALGADPNDSVDLTFTDGGAAGKLRTNIVDSDGYEMELTDSGMLSIISTASFNTFRIQASGASPNTMGDITFTDAGGNGEMRFNIENGSSNEPGGFEMSLDAAGNLTIDGNITVGTAGSTIPDYVFEPDYQLMPLHEVEAFITANGHLPKIPSAGEVKSQGLNMTQMQIALLEKVEELTLYTLRQERRINDQAAEIAALKAAAK